MIKNVFFDLDGTIVNSESGVHKGIKMALKACGYEEPEYATLRKCIGPPFSYSFPNILHIDPKDFDQAVEIYRKYYDEDGGMFDCEVYDGIEGLLAALVKKGYSLTICSSKPEHACKKLLTELGIAKYFSEICGSSLDGKVNSKEDVINLCFERSPWKHKDETILVGDTKFDAEGASVCDLACLGITWGFGTRDELFEYGAIEVCDTCDEVLDYIERN